MLNLRAVGRTLAILVAFLAVALLFPAMTGLGYGEPSWWAFAVTALLSAAIGAAGWYFLREEDPAELRVREGFLIVGLAWVVLALVGALPFVFGGILPSYTDAFFETISGFTTTGATVLGGHNTPAIEDIPNSFLLWRSITHWMGGMGIIVLTLAILPILGVGGMQLFKAEVPGPSADKLTPRVRETARRLWLIYVGITGLEVLLLTPAMGWFDAVNHAFATMATGGFSTKNGSVGQFGSAYVEWVVTIFMFLAGMNFALHYRALKGRAITVFRDTEFRVYTSIVLIATALLTLAIWAPFDRLFPVDPEMTHAIARYESFPEALRLAAFQASSIVTTTGFGTADYEVWSPLAIGVLFLLFFIGGMAGSTGGGVKVVRHVLMFKNSYKDIRQLIHPQAVLNVRLNGQVVPQDVMRNVLSFIVLYLGLIGFGTLGLAAGGVDLLSAFGGTISAVGNIGPAFGTLGPAENYAHLPDMAKWILSFLMIAGRLEIFTVMILFASAFWRR